MKQLLIIAHCPSPNSIELIETLNRSAHMEDRLDIQVVSPFDVTPATFLPADGVILFTTENFGYMSGALKDMFDRCYYPIIESKRGLPYVLIVKAGKDGTGAKKSCESIIKGLGWVKAQETLILKGECTGQLKDRFHEQLEELGEGFAVALAEGII